MTTELGLTGLNNLGNTCYLNAALQCLLHIPQLKEYILSDRFISELHKDRKETALIERLKTLFKTYWDENCIIQPITFLKLLCAAEPRFGGFHQQDSQEVLSIIIDYMHMALSYPVNITFSGEPKNKTDEIMIESIKNWGRSYNKEFSSILEMMYGQYYGNIVCMSCKTVSIIYEPFNMMIIPISNVEDTLEGCFRAFFNPEQLDTNNMWKCDKCHMVNQCIKTMKLCRIPKILIVVLKRFNNGRKITKCINIPQNIDIGKYIMGYDRNNAKFELISLINHTGTLNGGHYFAYCKTGNGKWYEFNDADVVELKDRVPTDNVYVSIYSRS